MTDLRVSQTLRVLLLISRASCLRGRFGRFPSMMPTLCLHYSTHDDVESGDDSIVRSRNQPPGGLRDTNHEDQIMSGVSFRGR